MLQFVYNWSIIVQRPIVTTCICCYNHSVWKKKNVWIERKTSVCTWAHRVITKLLCNLSFQKYYFGYKNKKCFELWTNWWDGQFVMPIPVFKTLRLLVLMFPTVYYCRFLFLPLNIPLMWYYNGSGWKRLFCMAFSVGVTLKVLVVLSLYKRQFVFFGSHIFLECVCDVWLD